MTSVCTSERLMPAASRPASSSVGGAVDDLRRAEAPRDVARRVLVEQRLHEQQAGLRDGRVAVDQRDLAEAARVGVDRHLRAHELRALVRPHLARSARRGTSAPGRGRSAPPRLNGIVVRTRALGAARVGRRVDLLRRHVHDARHAAGQRQRRRRPVRGSAAARSPGRCPARGSARRRSAAPPGRRPRSARRVRCRRHAPPGRGSSSRQTVATASHSRSRSGSPKTASAQPALGPGMTHH